jgi:hypothetical protein
MTSSFEHAEDEDRTSQCGRDAFRYRDFRGKNGFGGVVIPWRSMVRTG